MVVVADAVAERTAVVGTGPATLLGAAPSSRSFDDAPDEFADRPVTDIPYSIVAIDGASAAADECEHGVGTLEADGTFTRSATWSKRSGVVSAGPCNFSTGAKHLAVVASVAAVTALVVAGPAGPQGPAGPTGATGPQGDPGDPTLVADGAIPFAKVAGVEAAGAAAAAVSTHVSDDDPHGDRAYADAIATTTPAAGAVPKAGADGRLDAGFLDVVHRYTGSTGWGVPILAASVGGQTTAVGAGGRLLLTPLTPVRNVTITAAALRCVAVAAGTAELVLYSAVPADGLTVGYPFKVGDLIENFGAVSTASSVTQVIAGLSRALTAGVPYFLGAWFSAPGITFSALTPTPLGARLWRGDNANIVVSHVYSDAYASGPPASIQAGLTANQVVASTLVYCCGLKWEDT